MRVCGYCGNWLAECYAIGECKLIANMAIDKDTRIRDNSIDKPHAEPVISHTLGCVIVFQPAR